MASPKPKDMLHVLVTGVNSGLGLAICSRLIDEFLQRRPQSEHLMLVITTRDRQKGDDTIRKLRLHLQATLKKMDQRLTGISKIVEPRVHFQQEFVDLLKLSSVHALSRKLLQTLPKLDVVILNAGIGGWRSINWALAIMSILTDCIQAVTWPTYKIASIGMLTPPQGPPFMSSNTASATQQSKPEPRLGQVFTANLFGHYLLIHYLMSILSRSVHGRIIWVSSVETQASSFSFEDFQGLTTNFAYESSKRLIDILSLTSTLPSTSRYTKVYFDVNQSSLTTAPSSPTTKPRMYLSHPGVCATSIISLPLILVWAMIAVTHLARLFGSIWHTINPYTGAVSAVWLALSPQPQLDALERRDGAGKWGAATDRLGNERVQRTEVEGWGYGGANVMVKDAAEKMKREKGVGLATSAGSRPGAAAGGGMAEGRPMMGGGEGEGLGKGTGIEGSAGSVTYPGGAKGRRKGAVDATAKSRQEFEALGVKCWEEMERMRREWEEVLGIGLERMGLEKGMGVE